MVLTAEGNKVLEIIVASGSNGIDVVRIKTARASSVPRGYLQKLGIDDVHDANQIANFALVEWSDNIDISDKSPEEYFKKFYVRYTEDEWKIQRFLHALPKGWEMMNYSDFLIKRRKMIAEVIRAGYKKLV